MKRTAINLDGFYRAKIRRELKGATAERSNPLTQAALAWYQEADHVTQGIIEDQVIQVLRCYESHGAKHTGRIIKGFGTLAALELLAANIALTQHWLRP